MRYFVLVLAFFLAACATSGDNKETNNRKAAETNASLGQAYMQRGQYEIALEKLKRAVANDKTYAPAHTLLGALYEILGDTDLAETEYKAALKYDPADGDVNNNYGAFLCGIGRGAQAEPYFLKAIEDPFYQTPELAYANAGKCSLERGNLDNAETFLRQSLDIDSNYANALLPMADVSYRKGLFLRARAFLQRYEAVGIVSEESLLLGYRIESRLGDTDSANKYRNEFLQRYPSSKQVGQLADQEQE